MEHSSYRKMISNDDEPKPPLIHSLFSASKSQRSSTSSILRGRWHQNSRTSSTSSATVLVEQPKLKGPLGLSLLFEPSEPRVDFIFIHGLQGDSRKTWCFDSKDPSTFWPKEWLPCEPGFEHVRIHSFGYSADWSRSGSSALTIHDFAQDLMAQMFNSPSLKRNTNTSIVFVAHSMGGLIAKKAYLLGTRDPLYRDTAKRVHSFFFLGTPHRGSDSAVFMKYYLAFSPSTKEFPNELLPNSPTVRSINDEFRHVSNNVKIWSFFETATIAGHYIVSKDSAMIGLPGEHIQNLQGNHRELCKFDTHTNSNYITLRNSFQTTIESIEEDLGPRQREERKLQMEQIGSYLDISERPTRQLAIELDKRHEGSCEWLIRDARFREWLDCRNFDVHPNMESSELTANDRDHQLFWLKGPPGSGKSVAAGHIISYLDTHDVDCSYFFFKNGAQDTIRELLLSLAYQMAWHNFEIRQALMAMVKESDGSNIHGHIMVWNSIFLGRIFKDRFSKPQMWVIDALDECPINSVLTFLHMLAKVKGVPLRVFATSRPATLIERLLKQERIRYVEVHTGQAGSISDIAAYINANPKFFDANETDGIVSEIIKKSKGVFLWASLIVDRLADLWSIEDMEDELRRMPLEMNSLYTTILNDIRRSGSAELAKCILKWVVCSPEPLTTDAIKEAVRLDIGRTILASESNGVFLQICKSLITVDNESRVQVMHQTVREFLCSAESDSYIELDESHTRVAAVCLGHLTSRKFHAPTVSRTVIPAGSEGTTFDQHVDAHFSYNLAHSCAKTTELLGLLIKFTDTTIITWIERTARKSQLNRLLRTAQHFKQYISRQLESNSLSPDHQRVSDWVNDLTRLVTNFGSYLTESPSSIRTLIPPLCPTSSILYRTFAGLCRPKLICSSNQTWDKQLSSLSFSKKVRSVACNQQYVAVGLWDGIIPVVSSSTLEVTTSLIHGHLPIQKLMFGNISNIIASCDVRSLTLWRLPNVKLWSVQLPKEPKSLCFNNDDSKLYVTVKDKINQAIFILDVDDGRQVKPIPIEQDSSDSDESPRSRQTAPKKVIPQLIRVNPALGFVALAYRNSHLSLFSLDEEDNLEKICRFKKEGFSSAAIPPNILDVVFSPAFESNLLAIAYQKGIVTAEIVGWNVHQRNAADIYASILACSPDGHRLAVGDNQGGISLFTFEGLRLIRRIDGEGVATAIMFASSLRFYDVCGSKCDIWEPPELAQQSLIDDKASDLGEADALPPPDPDESALLPLMDTSEITVMVPGDDGGFVFYGREDGLVTVYDTAIREKVLGIPLHDSFVLHLEWQPREKVLLSIDASGLCIGTQLSTSPWKMMERRLHHRARGAVRRVLLKPKGLAFLLLMNEGEELWEDGEVVISSHSTEADRWILHPTDEARLLLFQGDKVHLYNWSGLERETQEGGASLVLPPDMTDLSLANEWCHRFGTDVLVQTIKAPSATGFVKFKASDLHPGTTSITLSGTIKRLADVRRMLGIHKSSIYFLNARGWVCSISLDVDAQTSWYLRHFFIPPFWRTGGEPMIQMLAGRQPTVVIAYRDNLVLFHRFLYMEDKISLGRTGET